MKARTNSRLAAVAVGIVIVLNGGAFAAELRPATVQAFTRYVQLSEARMEADLRGGSFLWISAWPEAKRDSAFARLRSGEVLIERVVPQDFGREILVPDALVHHWRGIVLIPGVTLHQTLALIQDYDRHEQIYAPEVVDARLMQRSGDDFKIFLRLRKKKIVTVVLNTEYDARFTRLDPTRVYSRSNSTRVAEVEDPGGPGERELPVGRDHGFLWRLNTYFRFHEVADGVYVQCEAISLSRDLPTGLGWLVRPFIEDIPRESLTFTLTRTREALRRRTTSVAEAGAIAPPASAPATSH